MTDDKHANRTLDAINTRGLTAKREYVRGLEQRRDAEAVSLLVECLCDESWYLRELAEEAFLRMGEEQAAVMLPLLGQGLWFTRTSAARVLGRLGFRPAVPGLLTLAEDGNETVRGTACDALVTLAHARGSTRIAHALHRLPPDLRRRRMEDFTRRDRPLAERLERLMRNEDLMSLEPADAFGDDHPAVRTGEDGVEWEVLTGPPPQERPHGAAPGHARSGEG
jgi:HEAT repeat protein